MEVKEMQLERHVINYTENKISKNILNLEAGFSNQWPAPVVNEDVSGGWNPEKATTKTEFRR